MRPLLIIPCSFLFLFFGCCGCGGQARFLFGIFTDGKHWSTTTGWTMGMAATLVVAAALIGFVGVMIYGNVEKTNENIAAMRKSVEQDVAAS